MFGFYTRVSGDVNSGVDKLFRDGCPYTFGIIVSKSALCPTITASIGPVFSGVGKYILSD